MMKDKDANTFPETLPLADHIFSKPHTDRSASPSVL
jgi:hypothetical protein